MILYALKAHISTSISDARTQEQKGIMEEPTSPSQESLEQALDAVRTSMVALLSEDRMTMRSFRRHIDELWGRVHRISSDQTTKEGRATLFTDIVSNVLRERTLSRILPGK